jgi:hypothetical protein
MSAMLPPMVMENNLLSLRAQSLADVGRAGQAVAAWRCACPSTFCCPGRARAHMRAQEA